MYRLWYGHLGGWPVWLGPVIMLVFWGLVITVFILLIRFLLVRGRMPGSVDTALEILKKRYARGEIGKDEYEEKKRDLI